MAAAFVVLSLCAASVYALGCLSHVIVWVDLFERRKPTFVCFEAYSARMGSLRAVFKPVCFGLRSSLPFYFISCHSFRDELLLVNLCSEPI